MLSRDPKRTKKHRILCHSYDDQLLGVVLLDFPLSPRQSPLFMITPSTCFLEIQKDDNPEFYVIVTMIPENDGS